MVTKWEYKVMALPLNDFNSFQKELSKIGEEGWELVNIIESPSLGKLFKTNSNCFAILKKTQG